jgi:hypothetical protein
MSALWLRVLLTGWAGRTVAAVAAVTAVVAASLAPLPLSMVRQLSASADRWLPAVLSTAVLQCTAPAVT